MSTLCSNTIPNYSASCDCSYKPAKKVKTFYIDRDKILEKLFGTKRYDPINNPYIYKV